MKNKTFVQNLHHLAHLYNVQTAYYDVARRRQQASADNLLAVLQALGAPVASLSDVPSAIRGRRQALRQQVLEPVIVVWDKNRPIIEACLPTRLADSPLRGRLELESGEQKEFKWSAGDPVVPLEQSELLFNAYRMLELEATLIVIENAGHGFKPLEGNAISPSLEVINRKVLDFFLRHLLDYHPN